MAVLHEIDLRMRCVVQVVHHILILLLQYSTKNHKDGFNKLPNYDDALAEIVKKNYDKKFERKKILHQEHNRKYFYNDFSKKKGGLHTSIKIDSLDLIVICVILKTKYLSTIKDKGRCCANCEHVCNRCGVVNCEDNETGNCDFASCKCGNTCDYIVYKLFIIVARAIRNSNAHINEALCAGFSAGTIQFEDFPDCKTWRDIWDVVNTASLNCLKRLENEGHITLDEYKDEEMNLRITLRKEPAFLLPIAGGYSKQYRDLIIGEAEKVEIFDRLKSVEESISKGDHNLLYLLICVGCPEKKYLF